MANKKDFKQVLNETLQDIKVNVGEEFDKNFERKAFFDQKWKPRKSKKAKGSLMIATGTLRNSIKTRARVKGNSIEFSSNVAYASVHNEGLRAGRGKGFTMPKRQFIGDSPKVQEICKEIIEHNINDYLNNLI